MSEPLKESLQFPGARPAPLPAEEAGRLQALHALDLLDTLPETAFDDIVQIAAAVCGVPVALVSLIDSERQWFKARVGLDTVETHRDLAFCAHALNAPGPLFEVPDAAADPRFADNPLVTGDPRIRFYAGTPLVTPEGHAIGTLCVIDREPRKLDAIQAEALHALGRRVMGELELRRSVARLRESRRIAEERRAITESIIDSMPSAVVVVDRQGRAQINNAAAVAISGLQIKDFPADPQDWPSAYGVHAVDGTPLQLHEMPLVRAMQGETVRHFDLLIRNARRPEGTFVEANSQPVIDADGTQIGATVVFTDISERHQAAAVLAASEHRYRTLVANMPVMVYRTSPTPPWRVLYASEACRQITGYAPGYFVERGASWADIMLAEDRPAVARAVAQAAAEGRAGVRVEYRIRHRDGSIRWIEDHDRLAIDSDALEGVMLDITDRKRAEAENAQSQERLRETARQLEYFRLIAEGTEYFVALAGLDRRVTYMNPAGLTALGLRSIAAVQATELLDYVFERDLPLATGEWLPALARDGQVSVEIEMRHFVTGAPVPVLWRAFRLDDPGTGEPYAIAAMGPLLGERRRLEAERAQQQQALTESEARFRLITDVAPQILWTAGADGEIDFVNGSGLAYFGRTLAQLGGTGWLEAVHPDDVANTLDLWRHSLASGEQVLVQYRIRRHDGQYRWHIVRGIAQLDPQGRPQRWFGVITDIESLKQAQTEAEQSNVALMRSEAHYRFLSEAIPQQVWTALPDGQIDYVNAFTCNYFQRPAERILHEGWVDLLHPDDVERTVQRWSRAIAHQGAEAYDVEFRLRRSDGEYRWNLARAAALMNPDGSVEKWFGTTVEIEEIKLAQQLAEDATRAKSAFLSSMSHEIRTPMNAVIGMTAILLDTDLTAQQREAAELIRSSGDHLLTVISDILDYSKIEAGKLDLECRAFSLRDCIEGALDLIAATASARGVELDYRMEAATPEQVLGDSGRLRQVLLNLLSNAVKFTPSGGAVMIEVRAQALDGARRRILFKVSDSGVGIDPEILPQLFQPFVQADASTTRKFGGTGLGLSICRRLVTAMGGSIDADSAPNRGSVFRFDIVVETTAAVQDETPPTRQPRPGGQRPPERGVPLRLLVVDDNPVNQKVARLLLGRSGYHADFAADGREALDRVAQKIYDAVLMDVQMPVMDGLTATRELCRLYDTASRPRIIGMTANATEEDRRECARAGMDDYLSKPILPQQLAAALLATRRRDAGEAPAADADFSVAGLAELRRIYGDDGAAEIADALQTDLIQQSIELHRSLEQQDVRTLQRVAHTLKSASLLVGAGSLGDDWDTLERQLEAGMSAGRNRLAQSLIGRYGRLVLQLRLETARS